MLDYVRCPTCGKPLGHIYSLYKAISTDLLKEQLEKHNTVVNLKNLSLLDDTFNIDKVAIYNMLHIDNYCCRMRLEGIMDFHDAFISNVPLTSASATKKSKKRS